MRNVKSPKFNNFMSKIFGIIFRSDRNACIRQLRELGVQGHADRMSALGLQSMKKA